MPWSPPPGAYIPTRFFFTITPCGPGETHFSSPFDAYRIACTPSSFSSPVRHIFVVLDGCASAIVAYYPYLVQRQYLGYGNVAKGWDGFQLDKGQVEFTSPGEGEERGWRGPGVERLKRCVISCAGQLITSFEPSTCRLLMR